MSDAPGGWEHMRSRWEKLAKLTALLLPPIVLVVVTIDPALRESSVDLVAWLALVPGFLALAWFFVVARKTRGLQESAWPSLQDLDPGDRRMVEGAWRTRASIPTSLVQYVRSFGQTQDVALHRSGWSLAAVGLFNMNTAISAGPVRWVGVALVVYLGVGGLALDLLHARWRRVLRALPHGASSVATTRPG